MSLEKIMSISGRPGLFKLISQARGGFVVESLTEDKKTRVGIQHNISMLSEISIYTYSGEVPLREVFQKISEKEDGKETISHKESANTLSEFFREVLPEYDEDQVYKSDIKKVVQWYNLLINNDFTDFSDPEEEKEDPKDASKKEEEKEKSEEN